MHRNNSLLTLSYFSYFIFFLLFWFFFLNADQNDVSVALRERGKKRKKRQK